MTSLPDAAAPASGPLSVSVTEDMRIPVSGGLTLSARVWMPEGAADTPYPAILEYIPYRKRDGTIARDEQIHPFIAAHGYVCLRIDLRGSGDSDGLLTDEYTATELADACDVIAFIAAQPWCSGDVGMMGKSWGGFNALQTAALAPPALKAITSQASASSVAVYSSVSSPSLSPEPRKSMRRHT